MTPDGLNILEVWIAWARAVAPILEASTAEEWTTDLSEVGRSMEQQ